MVREPDTPSVGRIALSALREAPASVRRGAVVMLIAVVLAVLVQQGIEFEPGRPESVIELLNVFLGSMGAFLFGVVYLLHHISQRAAVACGPLPRRGSVQVTTLNVILVALPALSFISGAMLAAAVGMLVVRAIAGAWLLLAAAVVYFVLLLMVARYVTRTTRFLYRYAHDQAEQAARAREEATNARLAALQAQMNPHFLFNSLNTVAALVRSDPRAAEHTVENLAAVLRRTLDRSARNLSSVRDEIEFLRTWLAVEQERWRSRLVVDWNIEDGALDCAIPTMSLQPLVENSLKYAIATRLEGGRLQVSARRDNGTLLLTVADDGPGFPPRYNEGTGLGNLRRRLGTLYGEAAELEIDGGGHGHGGAQVRIRLPFTRAAARE